MCRFLFAFKKKIRHPLLILFGILFGVYFVLNLLEIYYYPGLVKKYLFFPKEMISFFLYFSIILFGNRLIKIRILKTVLKIFLLSFAVLYMTFLTIESLNYSNYVLKTFHIHITEVLNLFAFILIVLILISETKIANIFYKENTFLIRMLTIISIVTMAIYLQIHFVNTMNYGLGDLLYIINNRYHNYEQKRGYRWKEIDMYIDLINTHTPSNAIILIPPNTQKWQTIGNGAIVKYFIRPRKVVSGDFSENFAHFDCALFVSGEYFVNTTTYDLWPRQKHDAKRIIYFNKITQSYQEIFSDFNPDDIRYSNSYGLFCVN